MGNLTKKLNSNLLTFAANKNEMRKLATQELGRPDLAAYESTPKLPLVIVLDNIRSQQNVGSVFRTSDAFLVERIVLCGITARPPHREIHRSALGATDSVKWEYAEDSKTAIETLAQEGYRIVGIEQTDQSISLKEFSPEENEKIALILGNEVNGISDDVLPLIHQCIELPQYGTKHSLNVSVCAGIVIWDLFNKLYNRL